MKFSNLIVLMLLSVSTLSAQYLGPKAVISKLCEDVGCIYEMANLNGFTYGNKSDLDNGHTSYIFFSDKRYNASSNTTISTQNNIVFYIGSLGYRSLGFSTSVKAQSNGFLQDLKSMGYSFHRSKESGIGLEMIYKSDKFPNVEVTFNTQTIKKPNLGTWKTYNWWVIYSI